MYYKYLLTLILLAMYSSDLSAEEQTTEKLTTMKATVADIPVDAGWNLVWSDEFDLDGAPNPAKWRYENLGFLRNKEEQWYSDSLDNAFVKDGYLHLVARLENNPQPNPRYKADSDNWKEQREKIEITSAGLITAGIAEFCYGRVVMRAKMPRGQGVWPAFWTIGNPSERRGWPDNGEIDIVEYIGREPHDKSWMQSALHWRSPEGKYQQRSGKYVIIEDLTADFNLYGMEWSAEKIDFFINDKIYFTQQLDECGNADYNAFRIPHFLLINLAIGGMLGKEVDRSCLPATYLIDYIRVYQKEIPQTDTIESKTLLEKIDK